MFKKMVLFGFLSISGISTIRCEGFTDTFKNQIAAHPAVAKLVRNAGIAFAAALICDTLCQQYFKIDEEQYKKDCAKVQQNKLHSGTTYVLRKPYYSSKVQTLLGTGIVLTVIAGCVACAGFGQAIAEGLGVQSLRHIVWG